MFHTPDAHYAYETSGLYEPNAPNKDGSAEVPRVGRRTKGIYILKHNINFIL
jgi:hypothetical protein